MAEGGVHGRGGRAWQGACMVGGGWAWQGGMCGKEGMHGEGACMAGGMHGRGICGRGHGWHGTCMARGHAWQGGHAWQVEVCMARGACMAGGMHGKGSMHGKGACMARGYAWQGNACQGACVAGGHAWEWRHAWKGSMCGRGHAWQGGCAWQESWPLQRTVRILLECIFFLQFPSLFVPYDVSKYQLKCRLGQEDSMSLVQILLVLLMLNGTAKGKLAILAFSHCGEFVKNSKEVA